MGVEDIRHIEWLMTTGLVRDVEAHAVCVSLGLAYGASCTPALGGRGGVAEECWRCFPSSQARASEERLLPVQPFRSPPATATLRLEANIAHQTGWAMVRSERRFDAQRLLP